jgi:RNA polymerase sigma factor (sigma-70 family)
LCWRSAGSIRRRDSVASFLHGVAYRIAHKARAAAARRQALEAKAVPGLPTSPADDLSWGEVRAILHEELAALPERWRAPLVLCYLEGLTQEEAARRLGWTAAGLKGRLQRGRERLRRRLRRRGLGLAALAAAALTEATVPQTLTAAAVRAALPVAGAAPPAAAVALAHGVSGPLLPAKVRVAVAVLLVTAALAGGAALYPRQPAEGEPAASAPRPAVPTPPSDRFGDPLPEGAVARLGTVRFNHGDGLNALHFTSDGKSILSEGGGSLCLWDASTGKELERFTTARPSFYHQTVLTPDGKRLLSLNQEDSDHVTLRAWDLSGGKEVRVAHLPARRGERSIDLRNALSPDGRLAIVHTPDHVRVFDLTTTGERYRLPKAGKEVQAVVFAGGDRLVTVDTKQLVQVWEAGTGKPLRQFALGSPVALFAASADGRRLATLEHRNVPFRLPGGKDLPLHERDVIHVWDLATGTEKHTLAARPKSWHFHLQMSPDGKRLFASSADDGAGDEVTVWDVETGQASGRLRGACGRAVAVSPDGTRLAEGDQGKFQLWDLTTGRRLSDADAPHALTETVCLSPAGDRVSTFGHASLSAWEGATGRHLGSVDVPAYPYVDPSNSHFFSADGRLAASFAGEGRLEILVWDVASRRRLQTLRPPGEPKYASGSVVHATRVFDPPRVTAAFTRDGSLLATWHAGEEPVVRLWDVRTGKELRSFRAAKGGWLAQPFFTADGKTLFVAGRWVTGYDVTDGTELFAWELKPLPSNSWLRLVIGGQPLDEDALMAWRALAVSPEGTTVAAILRGSWLSDERVPDRLVLLDARTGKARRRWSDSGNPCRRLEELAFAPDGRLLASSDGNAVHVWEAATAREVRTFRGHRGEIQSLAFSADGRRLASSSGDSTVLVWDLTMPAPSSGEPGVKELTVWWADLGGANAGRAYAAVWRLAEAPAVSVPFLRGHLRPVTEAQARQVRQDIADLDSDTFAVREKAFRELEALGPAAEPALREARGKPVSPEVRRRLDQLLEEVSSGPVSGEPLRTVRALAALEHAGTAEARRLMRELAEGVPGAWLTEEAQAAERRLTRTSASKP